MFPGTTLPARAISSTARRFPKDWTDDTKYNKTRYFEYTDNTFKTRKPQPEWLGILGPIIRAEVGDDIVVEFLNRSKHTHGIHPHGLRYDKNSEGGVYIPQGKGGAVGTDVKFTYHWFADEGSGPAREMRVQSCGGITRMEMRHRKPMKD